MTCNDHGGESGAEISRRRSGVVPRQERSRAVKPSPVGARARWDGDQGRVAGTRGQGRTASDQRRSTSVDHEPKSSKLVTMTWVYAPS